MGVACWDLWEAESIGNWEAGPRDHSPKAAKAVQTVEELWSMMMTGPVGMPVLRRAETYEMGRLR